MRLINTTTLRLKEFFGTIPEYAILSHTWRAEEATFEKFSQGQGTTKAGYEKITTACHKARRHGINYCRVDTCCIVKSSSADLTEAINSMFNWYKQAKMCYVFFVDLDYTDADDADEADSITTKLAKCRWFTRGWCLQELIAPNEIRFYNSRWNLIGTKSSLRQSIFDVTGIDHDVLQDSSRMFVAPIARRMSWASRRQTTRVEDMAYSLLGIFDVNMPMLYGEGEKAFIRLQEEIIKKSNDLSIFVWEPGSQMGTYTGLLAPSPMSFDECYDILSEHEDHSLSRVQFSMSNRGLMFIGHNLQVIEEHTTEERGDYVFPLDCCSVRGDTTRWKALILKKIGPGLYVRTGISGDFDGLLDSVPLNARSEREIYILPKVTANMEPRFETCHQSSFEIRFSDRRTMLVGEVEPREAWDGRRERFLTLPNWSLFAYMKVYLGEDIDPGSYVLTLSFRGPQLAPLVTLVHPNVWARFDIPGTTLAWKVIKAKEMQETVSGGSAHELWLADNKITVSLNTVENGGVPVHEVVLDWTPHGEDRESTLTYRPRTDSGSDGHLGDETWWDEGHHCYGISEGEVDEEIEQESYG